MEELKGGRVEGWKRSPVFLRFTSSTLQRPLRLRVSGIMNLRALRQQTFAATLASPRETGSPALRAHARAKTVLILSGALGAL